MRYKAVTILMAAGLLAACSGNEQPTDSKFIVVSIEPQRSILEALADSSFTIRTMLRRDADPESFDPSMSERMRVDSADIYFATGTLPFEKALSSSSPTPFTDTSVGVDFIFDTHGHDGHNHGSIPDPHYWSSVEGARIIARNMATELCSHYPADSTAISQRLNSYMAHLDSLDDRLTEILAPAEGGVFAIWHPSLSYFAREYKLKQISLGMEGKELSARGLQEALTKARQNDVRVFFYQKGIDSQQAVAVSGDISERSIAINPLDYNWEDQLMLIANGIAGKR